MTYYINEKDLPTKSVDIESKEAICNYFRNTTLLKSLTMFEWKGLPDTIPQRALEMTIQRCGGVNIFEWNGKLYQSFGNVSGALNYNYMPAYTMIANPYIKDFGSKCMKIYYGKDLPESNNEMKYDFEGVYIPNDFLYMGLMPVIDFYSQQLAENVISKRIVTINSRAMNIFIASDSGVKEDFENFIKKLKDGDITAILAKNIIKENTTLPFTANSSVRTLTDLIEDQQYIKASLFNEIGLNANYNMKRESITANESQLNEDALLPLPDQMLLCRKKGALQLSELFGNEVSVDFDSAWKEKRIEIEEIIKSIDDDGDSKSIHLDNDIDKERTNE